MVLTGADHSMILVCECSLHTLTWAHHFPAVHVSMVDKRPVRGCNTATTNSKLRLRYMTYRCTKWPRAVVVVLLISPKFTHKQQQHLLLTSHTTFLWYHRLVLVFTHYNGAKSSPTDLRNRFEFCAQSATKSTIYRSYNIIPGTTVFMLRHRKGTKFFLTTRSVPAEIPGIGQEHSHSQSLTCRSSRLVVTTHVPEGGDIPRHEKRSGRNNCFVCFIPRLAQEKLTHGWSTSNNVALAFFRAKGGESGRETPGNGSGGARCVQSTN